MQLLFRVVILLTNVFFGKCKFFKNCHIRDLTTVESFRVRSIDNNITSSFLRAEFNASNKKGEFEGIITIKMN